MWILILATLFTTLLNPSFGQSAEPTQITTPSATATPTPNLFDQYQKDYLYWRDQYNSLYLVYTNKKQIHIKYGTIITQKEKAVATQNVLVARNNLLKTYLMALRVSLDKRKLINPTDTEKLQIDLSKWEAWFDEQNTIVTSLNNEADISRFAADFKLKFIPIQQTIYTALVRDEINLNTQTLDLIQNLAADIQASVQFGQISRQWLSTFPVKSDLVTNSLKSALDQTKKKQNYNTFNNFYSSSKADLNKANSYLLEMYNNLRSVITKFNSQ